MGALRTASADTEGLYSIFGVEPDQMPKVEVVSAEEMAEPYRSLLAHDNHMTVTMERFHGTKVDVKVLEEIKGGDLYARKIILTHGETGKTVQYGLVRLNFQFMNDEVRDQILERKIPLGRVLIDHNVMRRISTHALLKMTPNDELREIFGIEAPSAGDEEPVIWGRLATIFCNEEPAIDLLEVPAPIEEIRSSET